MADIVCADPATHQPSITVHQPRMTTRHAKQCYWTGMINGNAIRLMCVSTAVLAVFAVVSPPPTHTLWAMLLSSCDF